MASEAVAVAAIVMLFGLIGLAMTLLVVFLIQVKKAKATAEYKLLAEEAVQSQRSLAESSREMNRLLIEIERLLREVG